MAEEKTVDDVTSQTNTDSEIDEQKELFEKKSAQELFDMGNLEFKENKNYEVAADRFSMAVEKKVKELNVQDNSIHVDLKEYYLCFADALLTKEEEKNDLFEFLKKKKKIEASDTDESPDKEEISDEQLAFEMFEFARKCYELYLENEKDLSIKDALNYSYVFIRLGDINLLNHFFDEALK
ncbi:conserved protein, unknown function, partial [Hepatocystis sp. ex Piliocolobus tephrosceles]